MKLLFAVDLGEPPEVIQFVEQLAEKLNAELLVLHVEVPIERVAAIPVDPLSGVGALAPYALFDPAVLREIEEARQHAFEEFIRKHFTRPIRPALKEGDPAEVILKDAEEQNVDMIVLGHRHRPWLEKVLLGSVAEEVVKRSTRPTLLVPIQEKK